MTAAAAPVPYWRLSGFYFFYFATVGALVPYFGLYLQALQFGPTEIGELIAILMVTKVVAPNLWAWIADRSASRLTVVRLASFLAVLAFAGVFFGSSFWWFAGVVACYSFFWNASLPQFEVITLTHLGAKANRYPWVRLWGSLGFIGAVIALGQLFDVYRIERLPIAVLILMTGIWLAAMVVPDRARGRVQVAHQPLREVLRRPEVLALLGSCFLMQLNHGPFYAFFSIYLESYGYGSGLIGQLWALGVAAEVAVFLVLHRWVERFGLRHLFLACLALTSLRWVIVAMFPRSLALIVFSQLLHAASFGVYHGVAIQFVYRFFLGRNQGRGQALYSSVSFGAGGALGSLLSGYLWVGAGPRITFLAAAAVSGLALLIAWRWLVADSGERPHATTQAYS